jgi:hypothetical protein
MWSGSVVRMKRSGRIPSAASPVSNRATFSSTNSRGERPSSSALWAMLIECSSVPVRKRVGTPFMRYQRAIASAAMTSYRVWRPGLLLAYAMEVVR